VNKQTSIYLDFLRFFAAIAVFNTHINLNNICPLIPTKWVCGQDAVIIFFILSGYVITYVANEKETNIKDYFISRFSRLYSVLLPALILAFLAFSIGYFINPQFYGMPKTDILLLRFLSALTFTNQIWLHDVNYLFSDPIWSLSYEFWYYVLFAFIFYLRGLKRYLLALFACLIMGPKILLLAPIWATGVLLYYLHQKIALSAQKAKFLFIFSLILLAAYIYIYHGLLNSFLLMDWHWTYSRTFLSNYILGLIIALNIFSFKYLDFKKVIDLEKPIKKCASITFSLYLYHFPLLYFFGAVLQHTPHNIFTLTQMILLTLLSIYFLAKYTELKKHVFKKYILKIWNFLEKSIRFFISGFENNTKEIN